MKILFNSIIIILGFIILFNEIFIPDNLFYSYKLLGIPFIGFGFINLKKRVKGLNIEEKKFKKAGIYLFVPVIVVLISKYFFGEFITILVLLIILPIYVYGAYKLYGYLKELDDYNKRFR